MSEPVLDATVLLDDRDRTEGNLRLLALVKRATPEELERVLGVLSAGAASGGPSELHLLAVGLASARRFDEAIPVFRAAIEAAPGRPEFRLNLAAAYVETGQVELAGATLDRAMAAAASGQVRMAGRTRDQVRAAFQRRRDELDKWIAWRDKQRQLVRLRIGMLRERVAAGDATMADRVQLASELLRLRKFPDTEETLAEVASVLEVAQAMEPRNAEVLELLAYLYVLIHDNRQHDMLRQLEEVAPDSRVLAAFTVSEEDVTRGMGDRRARAESLFEVAVTRIRTPDAEAALAELRLVARNSPRNREFRGMLMFGEYVNGNMAQAVALAESLAAEPDLSHGEHFNIGQVFWSHDEERGRAHLAAAYDKASTEQERRDVDEIIAMLEQRH
jgi:tetratricopeptide (TPR) repeat protein